MLPGQVFIVDKLYVFQSVALLTVYCSVLIETLINNHHTSRALIQHSMCNNVPIVHHSTSPYSRAYLVV